MSRGLLTATYIHTQSPSSRSFPSFPFTYCPSVQLFKIFRQIFSAFHRLRKPMDATEHASRNWAYSEDIPGSRCGPEDGPWPRPYRLLEEDELWRELRVLARPQSLKLDSKGRFKADSVNFQPSSTTKTQDRYVATQLEVKGRLWSFTGVFDGELSCQRAVQLLT